MEVIRVVLEIVGAVVLCAIGVTVLLRAILRAMKPGDVP